jgi:hypothetical protein
MVQGMININIMQDPIMAALTGRPFSGSQSRWLANQAFGSELWKNQRFYAGVRPGFSVHFYDISNGDYSSGNVNNGISFDLSAQFSIQIHQLFSLQLEVIATADAAAISYVRDMADETGNFLYRYETIYGFNYQSLIIPVIAKFTLRPDIFSLGILGGAYFSLPLGPVNCSDSFLGQKDNRTTTPNPGWLVGVSAGIKLGPGVLFLDMRFMSDFITTKVQGTRTTEIFNRGIAAFGIGYEIGFVNLR